MPGRDGSDDESVTLDGHVSGSAEAGGDANRLWCALFHRAAADVTTRDRRD